MNKELMRVSISISSINIKILYEMFYDLITTILLDVFGLIRH